MGVSAQNEFRSGDVIEGLTEVLREETRLPRAPASGEGKDLGGEKAVVRTSSNSPNGSEGRDRPSKKAKVTGTDHLPVVSGDNTVAKPFHWQISHSKDCPITEDPDRVSHLVRHFKPAGCPLSSLRNMTERDAYVKMAFAHAKAMEANNEFAATLERRLQDVPRSNELYEIEKVVQELKLGLKMAQDRERANAAQLTAAEKLGNQALRSRLEKWEKKKAAADYEARVKEVMANIGLLKEIMNNNLLASDELLRLRAKEVEPGYELDVMEVSDFSVGRLDLPQISEDLPDEFVAKVPSEVKEPGDEAKRVGGQFEDGKFDAEE
ncbi:hypothetical protein DY000_02007507 [Brassica cretica]|uniref:Uncharacterized protein n=1 Tax=Brassica cretica TaxID=69181 RepID=A0ABQ7BY36_BRACR|nr:hypothetical protein DY000_02007507 [Brassica cretica]